MPVLVPRNTINLSGANATNNYYLNHDVIVSRLFKDGRERTVRKRIVAYTGANRIATIDGLWDEDFIPGYYLPTADIQDKIARNDTYKLIPSYRDNRISTNPAIQAMDYITSERYGRGLDPLTDLDLPSWLESARTCDEQSDVTVEISAGTVAVGDIYRWPAAGPILWQGQVSSVFSAPVALVTKNFAKFTNVLGKLTNKWNSWKSLPANALVYSDKGMYITDGGVKATAPTHTSGTVNGLQYVPGIDITKVSGDVGSGATVTLPANVTPINPIRSAKNNAYISGYSLYDADGVDYWRYLGWDEHSQRWATQFQTNITVDTSIPLFDNMNSILEHFGGMLRYNNGKYYLEVEQAEGAIANSQTEPRNINADYIIGKVRLSDEGIRSAFNALTVAYADPANKFEAKNISFFNSTYLKADRNVQRKGSLSIPGVTNYYNARLLADKFLNKSRYGLTVSFNMAPRGALLLAGRVIQLQNSRYGWTDKKFRIENLTHNTDCTVDVVATEYDDSFYAVQAIRRQPGSAIGGEALLTTVGPPTNLVATSSTQGGLGGIELLWVNDAAANATFVSTEVYASYSPKLYITVTAIASNVFTSTAHGLVDGQVITAKSGTNGLQDSRAYYVRDVTANTFKLALTKGGTALTFTAGSGLTLSFLTATIIANVDAPRNTYFDAFTPGDSNPITKYYWVRYKVTQ